MCAKSVILVLFAFQIAASTAEKGNLQFRLSTSYDRLGHRILNKTTVERNTINVLKRVILILPDFDRPLNESYYADLRDQFFEKDNFNIFTAERVTKQTSNEALGVEVGEFLSALISKTGEKYLDFHLIGYSAGSEIASYAAGVFFEKQNRKLARLTVLNPVYDQGKESEVGLSDIVFVDVVHTDVRGNEKVRQLGSVDFYPNGGRNQPGCDATSVQDCNGVKSLEYFAKSIKSDKFKAVKCPSWEDFTARKCGNDELLVFGENVDKSASGTFYFQTDDKFDIVPY